MFEPMSILATTGIAAGFAAVGAFWGQIRSAFTRLSSFLILQTEIDYMLVEPVSRIVKLEYKALPTGLLYIKGRKIATPGFSTALIVPFAQHMGSSVWRGKRGWFLVSTENAKMKLVSIRGLSNPKKLIEDAVLKDQNRRDSEYQGNFYIAPVMGSVGAIVPERSVRSKSSSGEASLDVENSWREVILGVDKSFVYDEEIYLNRAQKNPTKGLFYPQYVHDLLEKVKQWYEQREWYNEHNIPWRKGILTHGIGGTGKSSFSRVIAQTLKVPLYHFYLNTLTDSEFAREWDDMTTPCVALLEDFDTCFHGREAVTAHKSLSFECVLNKISGVSTKNGVLLVVNTNHLEHIDPALGQIDENGLPTRPGRIDHIVHFGPTDEAQRMGIARLVLGGWAEERLQELVDKYENTTAAQFQGICVNEALTILAKKNHEESTN